MGAALDFAPAEVFVPVAVAGFLAVVVAVVLAGGVDGVWAYRLPASIAPAASTFSEIRKGLRMAYCPMQRSGPQNQGCLGGNAGELSARQAGRRDGSPIPGQF